MALSYSDFYQPDYTASGAADYSGAVNSSEPLVDIPPDASGGRGSFLSSLQGILTDGVQTLLTEKMSSALALQNARDLQAVNAVGKPAPKAAPVIAGQTINTWFMVGLGVLVLVGGALYLRKKF